MRAERDGGEKVFSGHTQQLFDESAARLQRAGGSSRQRMGTGFVGSGRGATTARLGRSVPIAPQWCRFRTAIRATRSTTDGLPRWLLTHPEQLTSAMRQPPYGTSGGEAEARRAALFGTDPLHRSRVIDEGLAALRVAGGSGSAHQWWAFEGFTHVDFCLSTPKLLLFVEGKRTDTVAPSTRWFAARNQLWRNVEAAREIATRGRREQYGVLLAVEQVSDGEDAMKAASDSRDASYPHLSDLERAHLDQHLIGFVTWSEVKTQFVLPETCFPEDTSE